MARINLLELIGRDTRLKRLASTRGRGVLRPLSVLQWSRSVSCRASSNSAICVQPGRRGSRPISAQPPRMAVRAGRLGLPRAGAAGRGRRTRVSRWWMPTEPIGGYRRWIRGPCTERLWIRRGRCSAWRRTHALFCRTSRWSGMSITCALVLGIVIGLGIPKVANQLGVPMTTARGWLRRFRCAPRH